MRATDIETQYVIDMDRVVELVRRADTFAYVEQTGGGTATIFAGPVACGFCNQDAPEGVGPFGTRLPWDGCPVGYDGQGGDHDWRYAACAGPGWFEGPNWTTARGDKRDFYIGPDDDSGSGDYMTAENADGSVLNHVLIAAAIVLQVKASVATRVQPTNQEG